MTDTRLAGQTCHWVTPDGTVCGAVAFGYVLLHVHVLDTGQIDDLRLFFCVAHRHEVAALGSDYAALDCECRAPADEENRP